MTDVGRSRRKGGDVRGRPPDKLPQPRAVRREARELVRRVQVFASIYDREHEALASIVTPDVSVMSMPFLTTVEAAVDDDNQQAARDRCREAVKFLRLAAANVDEALTAFGPEATQPDRDDDAVVSKSTFDRAVHRRRHYEREEELRSP